MNFTTVFHTHKHDHTVKVLDHTNTYIPELNKDGTISDAFPVELVRKMPKALFKSIIKNINICKDNWKKEENALEERDTPIKRKYGALIGFTVGSAVSAFGHLVEFFDKPWKQAVFSTAFTSTSTLLGVALAPGFPIHDNFTECKLKEYLRELNEQLGLEFVDFRINQNGIREFHIKYIQ